MTSGGSVSNEELSLSQVHQDLRAHLKLDERMRQVEIRQASLDTGMEALAREMKTMRDQKIEK